MASNSSRRNFPTLIALGLAFLTLGGAYVLLKPQPQSLQAEEAKVAPPAVTVSIAPAQVTSLLKNLQISGSVAPWEQLTVASELGGLRIEQVLAEEGQQVKKGQVLVLLDSTVLQTQLAQAQARRASAQAQVRQQQAILKQSQARLVESQINAQRATALLKEGAISGQSNLAQQTTLQSSQAQADQSLQAIGSAQSSLAEANAAIRQFQAQLAQTRIVAPDSGWVLKKGAFIGSISDVGVPLFTLARQNRLELNAQVPETDLPKLTLGQRVTVRSDADPQLLTQGVIRQIGPTVDSTSRQALVKVSLSPSPRLRSGMFVRAQVALAQTNVLTVPAQAVLLRDDRAQVFVLDGKQVRVRRVTLGSRNAQRVEIIAGLKSGELVVTSGGGYLKDGDTVKITTLPS
jgi:HlyD family secretion protein